VAEGDFVGQAEVDAVGVEVGGGERVGVG
jgi:hypothetical protein